MSEIFLSSLFLENRSGEQPLHEGVLYQRARVVRWILLVIPSAAQRATSKYSNVAMHYAASLMHQQQEDAVLQVVHRAWTGGVQTKNRRGDTPLVIACQFDRPINVVHLLRWWPEGAKVASGDGTLPIFIATTSSAMMKAFCDLSPDIAQTVDENGDLPLHRAVRRGNANAVKVLMQAYGAGKTQKNHNGETPIDCVRMSAYQRTDVLQALSQQ